MGSSSGIVIKRPSGIVVGLTAAWAIFGLFLALDQEMGLEPGALFQMVGIAFGVDPPNAAYVGFLLYMITAVIIGIVYSGICKITAVYVRELKYCISILC
jgi:hypothetical protein